MFADEVIGDEAALRLAEIVDEFSGDSDLRQRRAFGPPLRTLRSRGSICSAVS